LVGGAGVKSEHSESPATLKVNPGYVMTDLTMGVGGLLKLLVTLTSFRAKTPLDDADMAIWLSASPDVEGVTGEFWNKRREVAWKFRDTEAITRLVTLVDEQLASSAVSDRE
jgi:hypothetical protein